MNNYSAESKIFVFDTYKFDLMNLQAHFYFSLHDINNQTEVICFEEIIDFDDGNFDIREDINADVLENILFHIHLALGISYYKLYPTEKIYIKSGYIDDEGIKFWEKFYKNGLGEFLYRNNIDPYGLFQFECKSNKIIQKNYFNISEKILVPLGGGKDSIVSIELLKNNHTEFDTFIFGKIDEIKKKCIEKTKKNNLLVQRKLSENLRELNNSGRYFNGHVPITGIIAFVMQGVAYLYDYKYLILSNESSADYGNTQWNGIDINHQWSKSYDFEVSFGKYCKKYISSEIQYFSLLRGLYEIKIAEYFGKYGKEYLENFSSCNNNFQIYSNKIHTGFWCNNCPKCAFVYCMLHPYFSEKEMIKIFGLDLYNDKNQEQLFRELMGISGIKPFECVGTNEEVIYAMKKSISQYDSKKEIPYILQIFTQEIISNMSEDKWKELKSKLFNFSEKNNIPEKFIRIFDIK